MSRCDYWVLSGMEQWCELKGSQCDCDGRDERCSMRGSAAAAALRQAEKITLREAADRVRRNKHMREAG